MITTCPVCDSEDVQLVQPMWALDRYNTIEVIADCLDCGAELKLYAEAVYAIVIGEDG